MKRIILPSQEQDLILSEVDELTPIFAKMGGKLIGMIVQEKDGWILRLGGHIGSSGYHKTRKDLIEVSMQEFGIEFYVED